MDAAALAAVAAWLLAAAVATAIRPGELFEMAVIAAAGAVAWGMLAAYPAEARMRVVAALTLALPLVNTWPARAWVAAIDGAPQPVPWLLAPSTLLVAAIVAVAPRHRDIRSVFPYAVAAGALVAGATLSSLLADHPGAALEATVHTHAVPVALGFAVATSVRGARDGWLLIQAMAIGAAVPAVVGVAAYIVSFGVPLSSADLLEAKIALFRPYLFQELTFGNVGNLADFVLLTLPAATLGSVRLEAPRWLNVASGVAAVAILSALLLTASRGAMAIAGAEVAFIIGLLLVIRRGRRVLVPLALLAALAVVALSPEVRQTYSELLPQDTGTQGTGTPGTGTPDTGTPDTGTPDTSSDESASVRLDALKTGLRVARDNLPFGVGTGQYRAFDEVNTAPHSLLIQLLAENGIVGGLAFLAIAALLLLDGVRAFRPEQRALHDLFLLRAACLVGALGFLLHGLVAGAPLALGPVNVWAVLFWLQVGVIAALREAPDRAE